jgi:dTDP-glucose pyrophosphorylase
MKNWRECLVVPSASLRESIARIDASSVQIALVVDDGGKLLGTLTDGDVRRALLRGIDLDAPVSKVMNVQPTSAHISQERDSILALMRSRGLQHIPVVDDAGRVVELEMLADVIRAPERDNWVVLMAGGIGSRLRPLTDDCPKPMLRLGDRPILEHIVEAFAAYGFKHFYIAVNYLGEMIESYFGDGARWNVRIEYLKERERLGSAGALSLLPVRPTKPILVMNGDLVTKINLAHLLDFHESQGTTATMCVRSYEYQIPYGVVALDGDRLLAIEEKPQQRCFVSAGTYVLAPDALSLVEPDRYLDMPSLFERLIQAGHRTAAFPVREYWLDIGRLEDFDRAIGEFYREFR